MCTCVKGKQGVRYSSLFPILNYSTSFDRSDVTKVIYLNKSSFSSFTFTFMNTLHASSTSQLIIRLYRKARIFTGMKENSPRILSLVPRQLNSFFLYHDNIFFFCEIYRINYICEIYEIILYLLFKYIEHNRVVIKFSYE